MVLSLISNTEVAIVCEELVPNGETEVLLDVELLILIILDYISKMVAINVEVNGKVVGQNVVSFLVPKVGFNKGISEEIC